MFDGKLKGRIIALFTVFLALFVLVPMASAEKKKIGILVYDGVLTSDVTAPLEVFGVASRLTWFSDYEAVTISVSDKPMITTEEGLKIGVDTSIGQSPEVDALIVTSSYDMDPLIENKVLIDYIASTSKKAEWMASNCSGAYLLAEAGLLNGKQATTWAGGERDFQRDYPKVKVLSDTNYVVDGNVLTSNGSLVSYQAALKLLNLMTSQSKAQEVADALQYSRFSHQTF
ncbi:putative Transcriptional regulator containing an amidase domain and an AraC-type DNA-binding HTH domain [Vibrio nigripulchritudo MADA3029]|uniref:DJ-1/PfpI family protein n=1 Tax=Vibrio nigripulchritudo TaxID=28173 RepID=UPI0003B22C33|nr:DJ-1/PfpI family protein [Vibrio nigripulchritudo]CCN49643.1 putative Transcriptional regulator containing an amidase domain and an AraC-type DNA-binding HTH domain [Vibrio nigripulchritudo MADA3020]CCN52011.1 putative Transcriptional regulator containing an amidase domain and an AraC-type DNA-binding HTH domain [Vibrio nigripulchritudo MADA3021]CCN59388.1 putative Transcriptional regulator containing an amidase domain and an AraC-type DNA-binding HTH domain [Vibrio nigripulchritudo MADA3029]